MDYLSPDPILEPKRQTIRDSLDEIVSEIHSACMGAGLAYPIYASVPSSGNALITIATPLDPADREWDQMLEITREIVAKKTGIRRLASRSVASAMAGATMGSAEVVSEA